MSQAQIGYSVDSAPHRKTGGGPSYRNSESSRLLCASAYLDSRFRDTVLKYCLHERHKAPAPNFGIDLTTVVAHCQKARRMLQSREWWLLIPVLFIVVVAISNAQATVFTPDDVAREVAVVVTMYLIAFAICLWYEWRARAVVTRNFLRGRFRPSPLDPDDDLQRLSAADEGNVVIYSGFTPFVGSGLSMDGWSFALDLRKHAENGAGDSADTRSPVVSVDRTSAGDADRIRIEDLYDRIATDIDTLRLDRVTIEDKLYINGRDIRDDKRFLDHPLATPRNHLDERFVRDAMLQSEQQLRHYRCIRVVDWSGELVLSIFLRFSKLSHNLFVEASYYLLTPVGTHYRKVDSMNPNITVRQFLGMVVKSAVITFFLTIFVPIILLGRLLHRLQRWSEHREEIKQIRENPSFDYGANFSVRQFSTANEYRRYFQKLDKEMYFKVLEKNILDSILTFLEEHGVDVSELKQRETTILNNGVIVSGGNLSAENVSVGAGARVDSVKNQFTKAAKAVAGKKAS